MSTLIPTNNSVFKDLQKHLKKCWNLTAQPAESAMPGFGFIEQVIALTLPALLKMNLPADRITPIIIRGDSSANGHGCLINDKPVAWFAAECYASQSRADAFVPHEIIHAIHYSLSPEYAFTTRKEKNELGRQLVTEGIATLLTAQSMNIALEDALWSDAQTHEATRGWMSSIAKQLPQKCAELVEQWKEDAGDLFFANDPADPFRYRAGYAIGTWAALHVVKEQSLSPLTLLSLSRKQLDGYIQGALQAFALNPSCIPFNPAHII